MGEKINLTEAMERSRFVSPSGGDGGENDPLFGVLIALMSAEADKHRTDAERYNDLFRFYGVPMDGTKIVQPVVLDVELRINGIETSFAPLVERINKEVKYRADKLAEKKVSEVVGTGFDRINALLRDLERQTLEEIRRRDPDYEEPEW